MKILISETEGYQIFIEKSLPTYDIGKTYVAFYSKYVNSKNKDEYERKFEMYLTDNELEKLQLGLVQPG